MEPDERGQASRTEPRYREAVCAFHRTPSGARLTIAMMLTLTRGMRRRTRTALVLAAGVSRQMGIAQKSRFLYPWLPALTWRACACAAKVPGSDTRGENRTTAGNLAAASAGMGAAD